MDLSSPSRGNLQQVPYTVHSLNNVKKQGSSTGWMALANSGGSEKVMMAVMTQTKAVKGVG